MMFFRFLIFILFLLAALPLSALTGKAFFTKNGNLRDQWDYTLSFRTRQIRAQKKVVRGEKIRLVLLCGKISVQKGMRSVSAEGQLISPSGSVTVWSIPSRKETVKNDGIALHLIAETEFVFQDRDQPGIYKAVLIVKDDGTGETCTVETSVELTEKNMAKPEEKGLLGRMEFFYCTEDTASVIPALRKLVVEEIPVQQKNRGKKLNPLPALACFHYVFLRNPQLLPDLARLASALSGEAQNYVLFLFSLQDESTWTYLPENLKTRLKRPLNDPFAFSTPVLPWQTEVLWAEFYATGKRAPLLRILNTITPMRDGMTPQTFRALKTPTDQDKASLAAYLTGRSAVFALRQQIRKHPLVRNYLEYLLAANLIRDTFTKVMIDMIIQEASSAELPQKQPKKS